MAAAAGAVAQTGLAVINLLESRKGGSSARSVAIRIMNFTDATFTLVHDECRGGEYTEGLKPPQTIAAKNQSGFMAESHGFMTGTEGYARYAIGDGSTAGATLVIKWNNPYSGSNSNSAKVEGSTEYQVGTEGGSGNNASLSVKINGGPVAPAPPPAPAAPAAVPDEQAKAEGQENAEEGAEDQPQEDEGQAEGENYEGEGQADGEDYEGEGQAEGENYGEEGQAEGENYEEEGQAEGENYEGEEGHAEGENYEGEEPQEEEYGEDDHQQR